MMNRRQFVKGMGLAGAASGGALLTAGAWAIPPSSGQDARGVRFGIISDLHHRQWKHGEEPRLKEFIDAAIQARPDFIIQCGDFCRPAGSEGLMAEWNRFPGSKHHVLGNHDMDASDKAAIMQVWGMPSAYYSFDQGGFHFVVLDRNYLRNSDGSLTGYAKSNWSSLPSPQHSFTDAAQLDWLRKDLAGADKPVVVFMHQPVFLSDFFHELGNANEILAVFDHANYAAAKSSGNGRVSAVFMGHDHDDRYAERNGVHYFLLNSAAYAYCSSGAHFYSDSLFAFVTLDPAGKLTIEGRASTYRDNAPDEVRARFFAKISNRQLLLGPERLRNSSI